MSGKLSCLAENPGFDRGARHNVLADSPLYVEGMRGNGLGGMLLVGRCKPVKRCLAG